MDGSSPVVIATPPPPTTPQPRKKSFYAVADDALPGGLIMRGERGTPIQTRSPLGVECPLPLRPARVERKVGRMDQFDRQVRVAQPIDVSCMPHSRVESIARAALATEAARRGIMDDVRKSIADLFIKRGGDPAQVYAQLASDEAVVRLVRSMVSTHTSRQDPSPTERAVCVDARSPTDGIAAFDKEVETIVKPPVLGAAASLAAPRPTALVAHNIEQLQTTFTRSQRRGLKRSTNSAFSDATTETQSDMGAK